MPKLTITRNCAGSYSVSDGEYTVEIIHRSEFRGAAKWLARAEWDRYRYTDPLMTKREAVESAKLMIATPRMDV